MRHVCLLGAAALLACPTIAESQESYPPLTVSMGEFDEDAKKCGLRSHRVEAAIRSAMRYNRIAASSSESPFAFTVSFTANVVRPSSICAGSMHLRIVGFKFEEFGGRRIVATNEFCSQSAIFTSGKTLDTPVLDWVKTAFDSCLAEIDRYTFTGDAAEEAPNNDPFAK